MYSLQIRPRALAGMQEAYEWYEKQREGLGEEFLKELDAYYAKIKINPAYFKMVKKNIRQVSLKRFPYVVVYEVFKIEVVVYAIFHTKRNPGSKFK